MTEDARSHVCVHTFSFMATSCNLAVSLALRKEKVDIEKTSKGLSGVFPVYTKAWFGPDPSYKLKW